MRPLRDLEEKHNATFKLIDLEEPASFRSILYGQSVWLQIVSGPGEPTWRQGSVLGARVHGPGILPTNGVQPGSRIVKDNNDPNREVGVPFPFKAASSKPGDGNGAMNETFVRLLNKNAVVNCRWIVRPVHPNGRSKPEKMGHEVANMDYIYLEQDFFYITRVSQGSQVALKALCQKTNLCSKGKMGRNTKQYPVERRGIFRLRISDADDLGPAGEERSAALMRKAKKGLKRSEAIRDGHKCYMHCGQHGDSLTSGTMFPQQIR
ncbi:unnamed protein product, partial [Choristocarpus tenellus]